VNLDYFELQRLKLLISVECAKRYEEDPIRNKDVIDQLDGIYHKLIDAVIDAVNDLPEDLK